MSSIDEIMVYVFMSQVHTGNFADGSGGKEEMDAADDRVRDLIAAAIADARREGAEQMREAAAVAAWSSGIKQYKRLGAAQDAREVGSLCAQAIRDHPLPTGPRQAVRLTDAQIAEAFMSRCPAHLRGEHDVREMQARPDVMEMGRAIETAVLAKNGLGDAA